MVEFNIKLRKKSTPRIIDKQHFVISKCQDVISLYMNLDIKVISLYWDFQQTFN